MVIYSETKGFDDEKRTVNININVLFGDVSPRFLCFADRTR
jgi:predicted membrane protein